MTTYSIQAMTPIICHDTDEDEIHSPFEGWDYDPDLIIPSNAHTEAVHRIKMKYESIKSQGQQKEIARAFLNLF